MTSGWMDQFTDIFARRPSGWLGRTLYRHATGHQAGFRIALDAMPITPQDNVLDVGCGGGAFLSHVLATGAKGTGVDHSADMLATTRQTHADAIAAGRMHVLEGDAAHLPLPDAQFTRIFCLNAFFFFPDPATAIREMARVARPGATVAILTTPPEMESMARLVFGPVARRMRFDSAQDLTGWATQAGLVFRQLLPVPKGGILHISEKPGTGSLS